MIDQVSTHVRITPQLRTLGEEALETWRFREVLQVLVWRDLRVRYRQTAIGAAWILVQPLLLASVATLVFGRMRGLAGDGVPYPLFAYLGLWLWGFFGAALTGAANSLVGHSQLLGKVYLPPVIVPVASIATRLVDLAVGLPVLLGMMWFHGVAVTPGVLGAAGLLVVLVALCLGLGLVAASLMVRFRDVGQVLPFALQIGLFATPVVYSVQLFPPHVRAWVYLNPLAGLFEGIRAGLFASPVEPFGLTVAFGWTVLALWGGIKAFRAAERSLVDAL